jgi:hypothetical protein
MYNNFDIIILSHGNYQIIYGCVSLLLNSFPGAKVIIYRTEPDLSLSKKSLEKKLELESRGVVMVIPDKPLFPGDRGALTTKYIWRHYFENHDTPDQNKYCLFTLQDVFLVNPDLYKKHLENFIKLDYDVLTYYSLVADKFCYGTVFLSFKKNIIKFWLDHSLLGVIPCTTEWEITICLDKLKVYTANPIEKPQSQSGYNYYLGYSHFHDQESIKYYLDLYNKNNPSSQVVLDWEEVPDFISSNMTSHTKTNMKCPDDFHYKEEDIFPTAFFDLSNSSFENPYTRMEANHAVKDDGARLDLSGAYVSSSERFKTHHA